MMVHTRTILPIQKFFNSNLLIKILKNKPSMQHFLEFFY